MTGPAHGPQPGRLERPVGFGGNSTQLTVRGEPATVITEPTVMVDRPGVDRYVSYLVVLLFFLAIVTNPTLLSILVVLMAVFFLFLWAASRIGMLGGLGFLMGSARMARAQTPRPRHATLCFRCQFGDRIREVTLSGLDRGIELGDSLTVSGVLFNGVIRATRIENHTSGVVLRRAGVVSLVLTSAVAVYLLIVVLTQVVR